MKKPSIEGEGCVDPTGRAAYTPRTLHERLHSLPEAGLADRGALLEQCAGLVPDALDAEERHRFYKELARRIATRTDGIFEMSGMSSGDVE